MKVISGLVLTIFLYHNFVFSVENPQTYTDITISIKDNSSYVNVILHKSESKYPPLNLNLIIRDTQIIKDLQMSFDSELILSKTITNTKCIHFETTENLNFKVISWVEEVEASEFEEIRNYYLVLLKHSNRVLFWIESETGIKSCKLYKDKNSLYNLSVVEKRNSIIFTDDSKTQSALFPIVPATLKKTVDVEEGPFYFIKEPKFVPNIFGFLITTEETTIPLANLYSSDMGSEYGVQIHLLSSNPALPFYTIFIAPGDIVTSYNKRRYEIWGKSCIIEHDKGVYNTLCFIDTHAFTYNDKNNQWSISFYTPIRGYLQLDGKINTIYNALLYGDTQIQRSKIRGLCQVEKSEYFYFEVPACVESKIPFPEHVILEIPEKKEKEASKMPTILLQ